MRYVCFAAMCSLMILAAATGYCAGLAEPKDITLASGGEFSMAVQSDQYRYIVIRYENLSDDASIVWFTQLKAGQELPEDKIGPKFVRTKTFEQKGEHTTLVLISENTDQIKIHVEKGSIRVGVEQNNTR